VDLNNFLHKESPTQIQFNHNESELIEKFIEEKKTSKEEMREDKDHKTLNPTPDCPDIHPND
jgi:hypothetical protein